MTLKIIGLPQDNNSSFMTGPALGPDKIKEALFSNSSNMFSENGLDLGKEGIWEDLGNLNLNNLKGQAAFSKIRETILELLQKGDHFIGLGGDHSVSWPIIDAHAEIYSSLNILHVDAHPDLYDSLLDNKYSHASPFARLMESGKIKKLIQVGIRTLNKHQREQAERFDVEIHEMRDLSRVDKINFEGPVFCSVDLDALDPAFAPGVSHFEPGGMSTRYLLDLLRTFKGDLVGADIVEFNPRRDFHDLTAMVGAKILKELISRIFITNYN
tara:strand:+ start:209 stop:1018 length:810 start_codon:yes stop_codon:yes gene_type:complete